MKDDMRFNANSSVNHDDDSTESIVACNAEEQFDIVLDIVKAHTDKSII